ncbi:ribonuclease H-like domain-containing protein [Haloglomus litoreum]|uniref:ribonuclease H-like domain-containing protein n=1 Tax=Haloglomus litoreum TaxID=3034026 RepID=UPI0023E7CB58|nr:ribonuclease H-like domain-containing protein [Haloglomus sp. DT116]
MTPASGGSRDRGDRRNPESGRPGDHPVTDGGEPPTANPTPTLPPANGRPARLLALPGDLVSAYHRDTVAAMLDEVGPDAIVAVQPRAGIVDAGIPPDTEAPVLTPSRSHRPESVTAAGDTLVATIPDGADGLSAGDVRGRRGDDLTDAGVGAATGDALDTASHRVCLTTAVSLTVDPYRRSTSFDGLEAYRARLPQGWLTGPTTHCSTALRAGYRTTTTVDGGACSLVGIGRSEASLGAGAGDEAVRTATLVEVYRNGAVGVETVDPETFGIRGTTGVGEKRAETLRAAGYLTPIDIAEAPPHELADLSGLGRSTATSIRAAARARAHDTVVATGDDSLPSGQPVFVDIETDGLEPSCAWLVGVLDGGGADGHYMAFREREPGDTGHLESFLDWLEANAGGRPLVAWNGYNFDFPVLRTQICDHCPGYLDAWEDTYQFDLLWWARDRNGGNAALPGRSNKLEAVAEALGWHPETTGIDGGVVARVYTAYRRAYLAAEDSRRVDQPDWDRLERYCEDDVRALATIYDALADAARREPGTTSDTGDGGTQGALSDFT